MPQNDVLQFLDEQAAAGRFLTLDNFYWIYSRAKLFAYASKESWAIAFQVCAYFDRTQELGNFCYTFSPSLDTGRNISTLRVLHSGSHDTALSDRYRFVLNFSSGAQLCEINEKDYLACKIPISSTTSPVTDIARIVGWKYSNHVFFNAQEFDSHLSRLGLLGFDLLLQLDDWFHPNVAMDQLPSTSRSMRQIAEVIKYKNPSRYSLIGKGNTHWRKWPVT